MIYDINGNPLDYKDLSQNPLYQNLFFDYKFDEASGTYYTYIRIFKKRIDGTFQYPFVRQPTPTGTTTAFELANAEGWFLAINAGMGQGLIIQNSQVLVDQSPTIHVGALPLTINQNGDLGFLTNSDTTGKGEQIVASGVVSAACGFYPIIVDYQNYAYPAVPETEELPNWYHAQRQIIGQFENGDYCIITGEGRNFSNSVGFSIPEAQNVCKGLGLKFAYNLDGGGSTQTVLGLKNVNHIYEGTSGRLVESYIVFNGTDTYAIPNS